MTLRVLITGASGQLGRALQALCPEGVSLSCRDSRALDISDAAQVEQQIRESAPDLVINAAAYTQVDKAESEPARAQAVNAEGPANLARALGKAARLIHLSTDFVFDGSARQPYRPDDPPRPLSVYGQSKLAGERAVLNAKPSGSVVLRTAWVYAPWGHNFLHTMLRLMTSREALAVVEDQRGAPTSALSLARTVWDLALLPDAQGLHHWTDAGETSWHGFAQEIQRQALDRGLLQREIPVRAIPTREYPTPAKRPAYSVLDRSSTEALIGRAAQPWQEELGRVMGVLAESGVEQTG